MLLCFQCRSPMFAQTPGTSTAVAHNPSSNSQSSRMPPANVQYSESSDYETENRHSPLYPEEEEEIRAARLRSSPTIRHTTPLPAALSRSASRDSNLGGFSSVTTSPHALDSRCGSSMSSDRSFLHSAEHSPTAHHRYRARVRARAFSRGTHGNNFAHSRSSSRSSERSRSPDSVHSAYSWHSAHSHSSASHHATVPHIPAQVGVALSSACAAGSLSSMCSSSSVGALASSSTPHSHIFAHGASTPPFRPVATSPGLSGPLQSLSLRHSDSIGSIGSQVGFYGHCRSLH